MKLQRLLRLAFVFALCYANIFNHALAAETYGYDARGRLTSVTYTNGTAIYYTYDAAGNRVSSGPAAVATGTFTYVSGAHTSKGSPQDVVSLVVKNSGLGGITGITYTCVGGAGFHTYGSSSTSIAAGAQATYQCRSEASGGYSVTITLSGTNASNSPFATSL